MKLKTQSPVTASTRPSCAPFPSSSLKEAINYAYETDVLLICAAGNNGNDRKTYPAAYDNVMAVAGTDHSDQRMEHYYEFNGGWVNSSYGDWVDIADMVKMENVEI